MHGCSAHCSLGRGWALAGTESLCSQVIDAYYKQVSRGPSGAAFLAVCRGKVKPRVISHPLLSPRQWARRACPRPPVL